MTSPFQNRSLVIFDIDGTLLDSIGVWNEVDARLYTRLGLPPRPAAEVHVRREALLREHAAAANPYHEYCRVLGAEAGSPLSPEDILRLRYEICEELLADVVDYKPGADELVRRLHARGLRLAIASTTRRANLKIYLERNERIRSKAAFDAYFDPIFTREDASRSKPDPEIYLRVLRETGVPAAETVAIEDSLAGVESARAAGIDVVAVRDPASDRDRDAIRRLAGWFVPDFAALLALG